MAMYGCNGGEGSVEQIPITYNSNFTDINSNQKSMVKRILGSIDLITVNVKITNTISASSGSTVFSFTSISNNVKQLQVLTNKGHRVSITYNGNITIWAYESLAENEEIYCQFIVD